VGVVVFSIDEIEDLCSASANPLKEQVGCILLQQHPLLIFNPLHDPEKLGHQVAIIPLMILVEPQFVDAGQKTETGNELPPSWQLVHNIKSIVLNHRCQNGPQQTTKVRFTTGRRRSSQSTQTADIELIAHLAASAGQPVSTGCAVGKTRTAGLTDVSVRTAGAAKGTGSLVEVDNR
jgi:hypothetical protein